MLELRATSRIPVPGSRSVLWFLLILSEPFPCGVNKIVLGTSKARLSKPWDPTSNNLKFPAFVQSAPHQTKPNCAVLARYLLPSPALVSSGFRTTITLRLMLTLDF
jgi:hypothetical protein